LKGTGFLFSDFTPSAMLNAIKRAVCLYTDTSKMNKLVSDAMKMDFSWKRSAGRYIQLYDYAIKKKKRNV
jgi:starch synthase